MLNIRIHYIGFEVCLMKEKKKEKKKEDKRKKKKERRLTKLKFLCLVDKVYENVRVHSALE